MAGFPRAGHNYVYELYVKFGLIFRLLNVANNFLNQAHASLRPVCAWFLEIAFIWVVSMCICVCVHPQQSKGACGWDEGEGREGWVVAQKN